MFYDKLFFTVNLSLVNFLTCQRHHKIVKVKRDYRPDSVVVYFYFHATEELIADVNEYKSQDLPENKYLNTQAIKTEGVFSGGW